VPIAEINGIRFHYIVKGSGEDVFLLHGVTSSLASWFSGVVPALAPSFRVTAFDMRGHGLSEITPTGYTSRDMAGDVIAIMDHLGVASARLVGHSYGGCVAMHTALLHPDRVDGVVLMDAGLACLRHLRTIDGWSGWKTFGAQFARYGFDYKRFKKIDAKDDVSEIFRNTFSLPVQFGFRKGQTRGTPRMQKLINETTVGRDFREVAGMTMERLPEITAPVLALYGQTSPYVNIGAYLSSNLPNCVHQNLPESGHFYLLQDPTSAIDLMSPFLADPAGYVRREARLPGGVERPAEMVQTSSEDSK
jgi:pimeloyl-ACP methyl ester carboxylesterase